MMMVDKYLTIVLKYQGEEPPLTGFGIPVLDCEVTALALGDQIDRVFKLEDKLARLDEDEDE